MKDLIKVSVRDLRKNQTEAEKMLWSRLRKKAVAGLRFLRQYPIIFEYDSRERFFVADFYCHEKKTVIEVDGKIHDQQKDYDELRDFIMNELGLFVLRIKNEEIYENLDGVVERIREVTHPCPSLENGGEKETHPQPLP